MRMFNIPNLFTAANMLCGVLAILLSLFGRVDIAPYFIFLGAVLDFFDGFLARLLKQQGELGKQLDSLADMITFGLAPGVIMMVILVYSTGSGDVSQQFSIGDLMNVFMGIDDQSFITDVTYKWDLWKQHLLAFHDVNWIPFCGLIIPFFSMFRLAKFNIDTRQSESFIGLPTPANTLFFTCFPLLLSSYANVSVGWEHDLIMWLVQPIVLIPIIVIMSVLLVAEIPLFALKFKSFKWSGNEIRYSFLISCGILIPALGFWSIPIIVLLYLILSIVNNATRKKANA